jgi:hypothetical protein
MSSVRERIERPLREAPEELAGVADTPRVALGASGPTTSTRQRDQIALDATEVVTPSPHTRCGATDYMSGNFSRVRDRQLATDAMKPEVARRPKTEAELAADAGLAMHERWAREARQSEQAKIAARQKRLADEKAAAELKQRRATIQFQESQVLHEASDLTPDESQLFWLRLTVADKMLDVQFAAMVAESIRASRKV